MLACALLGAGCVHTYQPLSGLHDPVVVDPALPNFSGLRLDVYCAPGETLKESEAVQLCDRVGALFEGQGAVVKTIVADPQLEGEGLGMDLGEGETREPAELVLELRGGPGSRQEHPVSWGLFSLTFTLVPAVWESTFTQQLTVRDDTGFLLARRELRGRLIHSYGAGVWAGNWILDWLVREESERLSRDSLNRDLSADLYGQLSQAVFDATQQRRVADAREEAR